MRTRALWLGAAVLAASAIVGGGVVWFGVSAAALVAPLAVLAAAVAWLVNALVMARERLASQADANAASHEALQRRESQYRRVVEQVEQVIFQLDRDGRCTFLNSSWATS